MRTDLITNAPQAFRSRATSLGVSHARRTSSTAAGSRDRCYYFKPEPPVVRDDLLVAHEGLPMLAR